MRLTKQERQFLKRDGMTRDADLKRYEKSAKNIYIYYNRERITHRAAKKICGWRKFIWCLAYVIEHKTIAECRARIVESYYFTWKGKNFK